MAVVVVNAKAKAPVVVAMEVAVVDATARHAARAMRHALVAFHGMTTARAATKTNPHVRTTRTQRARAWHLTACPASPANPACRAHPVANLTPCAPAWT